MADFCLECTFNIFPELLPTGENDLAGLCEPGERVWAVCEGCGPGWFDFTGQRLSMPPDVAGILAITQATVQATETALFQLMQVAPMPQWAAALKQLALLKNKLADELARVEEEDELTENTPAAS